MKHKKHLRKGAGSGSGAEGESDDLEGGTGDAGPCGEDKETDEPFENRHPGSGNFLQRALGAAHHQQRGKRKEKSSGKFFSHTILGALAIHEELTEKV